MFVLFAIAASHAATQPVSVHPWSGGHVERTLPSQSTREWRSLEQCESVQGAPPPAPKPVAVLPETIPVALEPPSEWSSTPALHPDARTRASDPRSIPARLA